MTEQEIMQLAKEAGMFAMLGPLSHLLDHEIACLQRFANLVAERERELCAKVCDDEGAEWDIWRDGWHAANECAAAIRARNNKDNQQ